MRRILGRPSRHVHPLLSAVLLVVLIGCAPVPRFQRSEPFISIGVATGVRTLAVRLTRPASLFVDGEDRGLLPEGDYRVRLQAGSGQTKPEAASHAGGAVWIILQDGRGKTVAQAGQALSVRNGDLLLLDRVGRHERERVYPGRVDFVLWRGGIVVVNRLPLEDYVRGVLLAEISPKSPPEALKAQAVAVRSLALSQRRLAHTGAPFELCAEWHCQVYRGVPPDKTPVDEAIRATRGLVLLHGGRVIQALYSANCGGHTETASRLWRGSGLRYLRGVLDGPQNVDPDLAQERILDPWVRGKPEVFCKNAPRGRFRWVRVVKAQNLSARLERLSGSPVGDVKDVVVMRRGTSGRAVRVRVVGTARELTLDGELRIRHWLTEPGLPSSCFVVEKRENGAEREFVFRGAGYGHGVGMCQDGAVAMAKLGYRYWEILQHYYSDAQLIQLY
ncbi:MAG: SpoIID/LytB domain-containing protein [candidate division KSB1 bacterium]|nr:SpoIID/LytB domain-containing protein [candidate division KSB1 bacterium]